MSVMASSGDSTGGVHYGAAVAAAVLPGLGHMVSGRVGRGVGAMTGVLGLFLLGLLIGGIDAVDSKSGADKYWFIGQAFVGPIAFGVDYVHQNHFKAYDTGTGVLRTGNPGEKRVDDGARFVWRGLTAEEAAAGMGPPNEPGLGRLNEIAMLSCTLAGMLNFIVILDAAVPGTPGRRRDGRGEAGGGDGVGGGGGGS